MKKLAVFVVLLLVGISLFFFYYNLRNNHHEKDSKSDKNYFFSIKDGDYEVKFYGVKPSLDVGINIIFIQSNKKIDRAYFYMPPMPGMGEMREDVELKEISSGKYQGKVNISMAGGWQVIVVMEGKKLTYNLNIPFQAGKTNTQNSQNEIVLDSQKREMLGIETQAVEYRDFTEGFNAVAYVSYDMSKVKSLTLRSDGWVVDTFGRFEGEEIKKGTPLLKVLNPDLEIAKEELEFAKSIGKEDLEKAASEKLRYLGKGEVIKSPWNGVVIKKNVSDGGFAKSGEVLYQIVDTSDLWVIVEVPQVYSSSVRKGMEVLLTPVGSSEPIIGKIDYIFPEADKLSKTIKCRVKLKNSKNLKINQIMDAYIENSFGKVLVVPSSAVVDTGDKQIVFLEVSEGKYIPKKIKVGKCNQDYCQVLDGLKEGDKVVVKGNFFLDSESQIRNLY
ncbi:MAG: efflux RND transporter periplasmic adaptor subunit [Sulfurihydrogenibium sp.]